MIEVKELTKYYGEGSGMIKALDGITLMVEKEQFIAIIGSSGSGKSTLLHMIGGLDTPTSGTIKMNGKEISQMKSEELASLRRREIGFVFQNYNLLPMLSVYENIVLPLQLDGQKADQGFLEKLIGLLKINDKLDHLPTHLSGGEQQRVAIARAFITKPSVLLMDEPTGSLDSKNRQEVMQLLEESCKEFHQTIVMITHNEELLGYVDRSIRMEDGRLAE